MFAEDVSVYLADFGSMTHWTPSTGGSQVNGLMLFEQPAEVVEGVISKQYMVRFPTAAWLGLKRGEQLVIDDEGAGATYRLRTDPKTEDDAVFSVVELTKV
jgi:hypothetical protein